MHKRTKRLIGYAESCGFVLDGVDGQGHWLLRHPNGETVRVSGSPGDWRGDANCEAEIRRKSGQSPPRPSAGRFHHRRRHGFSMRAALREKDESKSGRHQTTSDSFAMQTVVYVHPRLAELHRQRDELGARIAETPYPFLIQEARRIDQEIREFPQ